MALLGRVSDEALFQFQSFALIKGFGLDVDVVVIRNSADLQWFLLLAKPSASCMVGGNLRAATKQSFRKQEKRRPQQHKPDQLHLLPNLHTEVRLRYHLIITAKASSSQHHRSCINRRRSARVQTSISSASNLLRPWSRQSVCMDLQSRWTSYSFPGTSHSLA